jgi:hypothetical protein
MHECNAHFCFLSISSLTSWDVTLEKTKNLQSPFFTVMIVVIVSAHEVLHSIVHSKSKGVVLKLDYKKAFDRVILDFF